MHKLTLFFFTWLQEIHEELEKISKYYTNKADDHWLKFSENVNIQFIKSFEAVARNGIAAFKGIFEKGYSDKIIPRIKIKTYILNGAIKTKPRIHLLHQSLHQFERVLYEKIYSKAKIFDLDQEPGYLEKFSWESILRMIQDVILVFENKCHILSENLSRLENYVSLSYVKQDDETKHECHSSFMNNFEKNIINLNKKTCVIDMSSCEIVDIFVIYNLDAKNDLMKNHKEAFTSLKNNINDRLRSSFAKIDSINEDVEKSSVFPHESAEGCLTSLNAIENVLLKLTSVNRILIDSGNAIVCMKKNSMSVSSEVTNMIKNYIKLHETTTLSINDIKVNIMLQFKLHKDQIISRAEILKCTIYKYTMKVRNLLPTNFTLNSTEALNIITILEKEFDSISNERHINKFLQSISLPLVSFIILDSTKDDLRFFRNTWTLIEDWRDEWDKWKVQNFMQIYVNTSSIVMSKLKNRFDDLNKGEHCKRFTILIELKFDLEEVYDLLEIIDALQKSKFQSHHWVILQDITSEKELIRQDKINLNYLVNRNFYLYKTSIVSLCLRSVDEYQIATKVEEIEQKAKCIRLNILEQSQHAPEITDILTAKKCINDLKRSLKVLDGSKYYEVHIEKSISLWERLNCLYNLLDEVVQSQKEYLVWSKFFNLHDVRCHIVNIGLRYDESYLSWIKLLQILNSDCDLYSEINQHNIRLIIRDLRKYCKLFSSLTEAYLDELRQCCPRINFFSDEELILTLSDNETFKYLNTYIHKIFPHISKIEFIKSSSDLYCEATSFISLDGEKIDFLFRPLVRPEDVVSTINKIHDAIKYTLQEQVKKCKSCLKTVGNKFEQLLDIYSLQACSLALLVMFSSEFTKHKNSCHKDSDSLQGQKKYLDDMISRIQQTLNNKKTELICNMKLKMFLKVAVFIRNQVRFFKEDSNLKNLIIYSLDRSTGNLTLTVNTTTVTYGWEYQGLTVRLPITFSIQSYNSETIERINSGYIAVYPNGILSTEVAAYILGRSMRVVTSHASISLRFISAMFRGAMKTATVLIYKHNTTTPRDIYNNSMQILSMFIQYKRITGVKSICNEANVWQQRLMFENIKNIHELAVIVVVVPNQNIFTEIFLEVSTGDSPIKLLSGPTWQVTINKY